MADSMESSLMEARNYVSTDPNADGGSEATVAKLHYSNSTDEYSPSSSILDSTGSNRSQVLEENTSCNDLDDLEPKADEIKQNFPETADFVIIGTDVDDCMNLKNCFELLLVKQAGKPERKAHGVTQTYNPDERRLDVYEVASKTCTFYFILIDEYLASNNFCKLVNEQFIEQALREESWRIIPVSNVLKWDIYGLNGLKDIKLDVFLKGRSLSDAENFTKVDLDAKLVRQLENMFSNKNYLYETREKKRDEKIEIYRTKERQKRKEEKYRFDRDLGRVHTQQEQALQDNQVSSQSNSSLDTTVSSDCPQSSCDQTVPRVEPMSRDTGMLSRVGQTGADVRGTVTIGSTTQGMPQGPANIIAQQVIIQGGNITIQNNGQNITAVTDAGESSIRIRGQSAVETQRAPPVSPPVAASTARARSPTDNAGETKAKRLAFSQSATDYTPQGPQQVPQQMPQLMPYVPQTMAPTVFGNPAQPGMVYVPHTTYIPVPLSSIQAMQGMQSSLATGQQYHMSQGLQGHAVAGLQNPLIQELRGPAQAAGEPSIDSELYSGANSSSICLDADDQLLIEQCRNQHK